MGYRYHLTFFCIVVELDNCAGENRVDKRIVALASPPFSPNESLNFLCITLFSMSDPVNCNSILLNIKEYPVVSDPQSVWWFKIVEFFDIWDIGKFFKIFYPGEDFAHFSFVYFG